MKILIKDVRDVMHKHNVDKMVVIGVTKELPEEADVDVINDRLYRHAILNDKPTLVGLLSSETSSAGWMMGFDEVFMPLHQIMDNRYIHRSKMP